MAELNKQKGKLWFEKSVLILSKGVEISSFEKTTSNWSPGKGKSKVRSKGGKKRAENGTIIVLCGGENLYHNKRFNGTNPDGTKERRNYKCESSFQDELYGKNRRVANAAESKGAKKGNFRCSVCGRDHTVRS